MHEVAVALDELRQSAAEIAGLQQQRCIAFYRLGTLLKIVQEHMPLHQIADTVGLPKEELSRAVRVVSAVDEAEFLLHVESLGPGVTWSKVARNILQHASSDSSLVCQVRALVERVKKGHQPTAEYELNRIESLVQAASKRWPPDELPFCSCVICDEPAPSSGHTIVHSDSLPEYPICDKCLQQGCEPDGSMVSKAWKQLARRFA